MTDTASTAHSIHDPHLISSHFTPLRPASQPHAPTRIDTEGRRSRFHSPPPPPGASPSLLLPTPNHHVRTSTTPTMLVEDVFCSTLDSLEGNLSPLKAPIFELEPDSGSQRSATSTSDMIVYLHKWYLKFRATEIGILPLSQRNEDLTHWIVVGGVRVDRANDESRRGKNESWRSSFVHKRTSATRFETASGAIYELVGPCDFDQTSMRTTSSLAASFKDGLPDNWLDVVAAEARRLGHVRLEGESESDSFIPIKRKSMQGKKIAHKRKAVSSPGSDIVPLSRRDSSVSSSLASSNASADVQRKKPRNSQKAVSGTTFTPKGIARELLQLQTSKLGNLALVEAAINESMSTPERQAPQKIKKGNKKAAKETIENGTIGHHKKKEQIAKACPTTTPLRSSGRARSGMREWWKVSSQSESKGISRAGNQAKPTKEVHTQIGESPGARLAQTTDASDSEEEYKAPSSSEDEEVDLKEMVVKAAPKTYARKKIKVSKKANSKEKNQRSIVDAFGILEEQRPVVPPIHLVLEEKAQEELVSNVEVQAEHELQEETPVVEAVLEEQSTVVSLVHRYFEAESEKEVRSTDEEHQKEQVENDLPILEAEFDQEEDTRKQPVEAEVEAKESHILGNEEGTIISQTKEAITRGDSPNCKLLPDVLVIEDIDERYVAEESLFYFSD